jgi:hypothetical protein
MKARLAHRTVSKSLIERLVDAPNLARIVHALDAQTFSALVRRIGIEDAGALIGLATRDQLEAAFDDDLFTNKVPGEREAFDRSRFVLWLEALLAEGDSFAADRIASRPEDFVVEALSSIVAILDEDALLMRMRAQVPDADDKAAPERPLSTGIDGYVIEARIEEGFDAAVSLIVALDQSRPEFVARILDRCARVTERFVDEADELADALSAEGSLGEDVEAAREARRSAKGFVEARSAAGFLLLAREPVVEGTASAERDPVTHDYLRSLEPSKPRAVHEFDTPPRLLHTIESFARSSGATKPAGDSVQARPRSGVRVSGLVEAMRRLRHEDSQAFAKRLDEFAYLTNVLMAAGHTAQGARLEQSAAAEAVLATVEFGAQLLVPQWPTKAKRREASVEALADVLRMNQADVLFRRASSTLVGDKLPGGVRGYLKSHAEFERATKLLHKVTSPHVRSASAR